jgi:hypothetical protein
MRAVIVSILFIAMLNSCTSARGLPMKKYANNINKIVNSACNKQAYNITRNVEVYNCLRINTSNNCRYIDGYLTFIKVKESCVLKHNSEIGTGIIISIAGWIMLMILCQCQK